MRSVVLDAPGDLRLRERPDPGAPPAGSARVRVRRIGVCGTDFHAYRGRQPFFSYPRVLGHELAVEIVEPPAGAPGWQAGDLCAVEPYLNCGACAACLAGRGNCCERLRVLGVHVDGGMCETLLLPIEKLHRCAGVPSDVLVLVETISVGAHAVSRAGEVGGRDVLVVGAGPIGMSTAMVARASGAQVAVIDVSETRLAFCRDALGLTAAAPASDGAIDEQVRGLFGGRAPAIVFDATGHAGAMERSFRLPGHGGTLVFVGLVQASLTFHDPDFHRRELTVLASRNALPSDFARVIALVESGAVDLTRWISARAPLEEAPRALPAWAEPGSGVIKGILEV